MDGFIQEMVELFRKYISVELVIFLVSMMPILELRGGLVAAALLGVDLWIAFPICVIGNMLPIPLVLLLIRKIIGWLKTTKAFSNLAQKLEKRAAEKSTKLTESKFRFWGLFLFVGIPLPGTGAWTGALVADALDIRIKYSLPIITVGVVCAGILTSLISYGIPALVAYF